MMSFGNLEHQFADVYSEMKKVYGIGDYAGAMRLIERAFDLCKKLHEQATDPSKRQLWESNLRGLKEYYQICKSRLGASASPANPSQPQQARTAPKPGGQQGLSPDKPNKPAQGTKGQKDKEEINFNVNGIDVQQFLSSEATEDVDFDGVVGMENEKKIIKNEFFISDEERKFKEHLGIKNKNFILLYGVPGTGKTYFATAISNEFKKRAGENSVPFFNIKSGSIVDSKVGQSEKNIAAVFDFAKQFERCVLFFDEFDALVPDRNADTGNPVAKTNVTTFLQMIDGFNSGKGTLVIAATNFPDALDGAILSRANEKIDIPLPSVEVLRGMVKQKVGRLLASDVDLDVLAKRLEGYSSRDVKMFSEKLKGYVFEEYQSKKYGDEFNEYKITNDMVNKAISIIRPSTKHSDLLRIERYKKTGE